MCRFRAKECLTDSSGITENLLCIVIITGLTGICCERTADLESPLNLAGSTLLLVKSLKKHWTNSPDVWRSLHLQLRRGPGHGRAVGRWLIQSPRLPFLLHVYPGFREGRGISSTGRTIPSTWICFLASQLTQLT